MTGVFSNMETTDKQLDELSCSPTIIGSKSFCQPSREAEVYGQLVLLLRGCGCDDASALAISGDIKCYIASRKEKIAESADYSTVAGIWTYCQNRLKEISLINQLFPTPSSVVTVAAFMGFLSLLAFGSNALHGEDGSCFKLFVQKFLPSYDPELMYSTFRCGIVHAMSFYPGLSAPRPSDAPTSKQYPKLLVTHSQSWQNLDAASYDGVSIPVIQVAKLCDDLTTAVEVMFDDSMVQVNCVKFMNWQPAICAETFNNNDSKAAALSGLYNPAR